MTAAGLDLAALGLTSLPGVGPARAERLERLGLASVRDLLVLVPRGLVRQGGRVTAADAAASVGERVSVVGTLSAPSLFRRGRRRSVLSANLVDETGKLKVLFFNQPWLLEKLRGLSESGAEVELYGQVVESKSGPALSSPRIADDERPLPAPGTILPLYDLTDGIGQEFLRRLACAAAVEHADALDEPLSPEERDGLPALDEAVRELHVPSGEEAFRAACRRLALERHLVVQARLLDRRARAARGRARAVTLDAGALAGLHAALPLRPTAGQDAVMTEVLADLARTRPMRRLLQGDVGSGKTLVALHALAVASRAGGQAALLVPTEILAAQHHRSLAPWLAEAGLAPVLVTGSRAAAERRRAAAELADGSARVAIGTHALLQEGVAFRRLDLVVIDEQQRFGVDQKRTLLDKGEDVHALFMTATPIPRTLALSLYGDLDVSILAEKPGGRGELSTHVVPPEKRARMLGFLDERMQAGERVFWVCPRIEGEEEDAAAEVVQRELAGGRLRPHGVELVHGRLAADERATRLERFRSGAARLLVGTTIVEVGVDVPEATVMVIEGAHRFGLAQLHQLRGRVGRGPRPSWCFLLGPETGCDRLRFLETTDDGFRIAEEDLRVRGMGELAGSRQSGRDVEGLEDPGVDLDLVLRARALVRERPDLARRYGAGGGAAPALV
jgi:ATP-dependent DNA helicase RecG